VIVLRITCSINYYEDAVMIDDAGEVIKIDFSNERTVKFEAISHYRPMQTTSPHPTESTLCKFVQVFASFHRGILYYSPLAETNCSSIYVRIHMPPEILKSHFLFLREETS